MNPYKIEPPFVISFSGGRTSGYMLKQILDAYDGKLPVGGIVCFVAPLHSAGATEETVLAYWKQSEFDLILPNNDKAFGNCDLCFLKSQSRTERVIEHEPARANWWADMEALVGAKFRKDRAMYKDLLVQVTTQGKLFQDQVDDSRPCDCTE